jgi:hypothetical protein
MTVGKALLKSSLVASVVFAAAWLRQPPVEMLRIFIGYGILITVFSLVLGFPLARLIERLKIGRWWSYFAFAALTGALLGAILSSHPSSCAQPAVRDEQETCIENPFAITFSPWTRSQPGFAENPSIQWSVYVGTVVFGAVIGSVLGFSFWFFYRYRARSGTDTTGP